jgi:hypothetical protein
VKFSRRFAVILFGGVVGLSATLVSVPAANAAETSIAADEGALISAIQVANDSSGPDVIRIATGTIVLSDSLPAITDSLAILGPGSTQLTIDGNGYEALRAVDASLTVEGLRVTGAAIGIDVDSAGLSLSDVVVDSCTSAVTLDGGDLTVAGSEFRDNGSPGILGTVGGTDVVDISDSRFTGNTDYGLRLLAGDAAEIGIARVVASETHSAGMAIGLWVQTSGDANTVALSDVTAADNEGIGIYTLTSHDAVLTIARAITTGNGVNGIRVTGTAASAVISDSTSSGNGNLYEGYGSGISFSSNSDLPLTIERSTISGNLGYVVAGVLGEMGDGSSLTVVNSTITGNEASGQGEEAALYVYSFGSRPVALDVLHSTIVGNTGAVHGVGAWLATVRIEHSILAGSSGSTDLDVEDSTLTVEHSLVQTAGSTAQSAIAAGSGNLTADPGLAPLDDNGGPTLTMLPLEGSPVIDAGDPAIANAPASDQRGGDYLRVYGTIDLGAVEVQPEPQGSGDDPSDDPGEAGLAATGFDGMSVVLIGSSILLLGLLLRATRSRASRSRS